MSQPEPVLTARTLPPAPTWTTCGGGGVRLYVDVADVALWLSLVLDVATGDGEEWIVDAIRDRFLDSLEGSS